MRLNEKDIIIFPEYHLSDFPPQVSFIQHEVKKTLRNINVGNSDIVISGYVEKFRGNLYSSCLIIDGDKVYNIRKKYPFKNEKNIISGGCKDMINIPLSIGSSYFFICNDITVELESQTFYDFALINKVENIFLISAMGRNFEKWSEKLKNTAKKMEIKNVVCCDRFNGVLLWNIEENI